MLRLADYGVSSCKTDSFDAVKISKKLIEVLGVEKFTDIEKELRTKGSDIAKGYPTRRTHFRVAGIPEFHPDSEHFSEPPKT